MNSWRERAIWLAIAVYLILAVGFAWNPTPFAQMLAAVAICAAFTHAVLSYGWRDAAAFAAISLVISFGMETIGTTTGLPFGHYHFTVGAGLPHIGVIPIIVGPLWFGMGYFSWCVAGCLLAGRPRRRLVALPLLAASVMTMWDLVMDPSNSTIFKVWIWHDGGADFGVPLSNYAGWLLTSWLFFQGFASYRHGRPAPSPSPRLAYTAILFYLTAGLTYLTPCLIAQGGQVTDAAGHIWQIDAIHLTSAAIMLLTIGLTSAVAAVKVSKQEALFF
jgi:putative membrane protein